MFQCSKHCAFPGFLKAFSKTLRIYARPLLLIFSATSALQCEAADQTLYPARVFAEEKSNHFVTNAVQFRLLSGADYLDGCDFNLTGVVTLVDTNRSLMVLQDDTAAVALNFSLRDTKLQFGQRVSLEGTNCCPYFAQFPDYPLRPSGHELRTSFEAPTGFGEYYLTRMRGYLHPTSTGEYSFWIASDNSSELWLSMDSSPSKARKIAFIPRFEWVAPREWSHFPSQHSEPIWLQAGKTYYIEALQEQTTVGDNLAVAWQGSGLKQSVIDGRYLTPWSSGPMDLTTNGILREFWTNYMAGDLTDVGGAHPFQSALSVESVGVRILDQGQLPKPDSIILGQPWRAENNYRWVTTEGLVRFIGAKENAIRFELAGEQAQVQVCVPRMETLFLQRMQNAHVRVEGVCEGVYDKNENLEPGIIWVPSENDIHFIESAETNAPVAADERADTASTINTNQAMQGFYSTRGVVIFNDQVLGKDCLVVQEGESAMLVSGGETAFYQKQLKVGEWVELGGALQPGKYLPALAPLVITELGRHSLPAPIVRPLDSSHIKNSEGKWSELEGVVHTVNSNGTLSVMTEDGPCRLWLGQTSSNDLAHWVDAKLRVRGVLMQNTTNVPLLLVPSSGFVDEEEVPPEDPFKTPKKLVADLILENTETSLCQRVLIVGEVTYSDTQSFFVQDNSGGVRVQTSNKPLVKVGETVEVVAFPMPSNSTCVLTDALVRTVEPAKNISPEELDLSESVPSSQRGTLVSVSAILLARKTNGVNQILELEEQRHVLTATLAKNQGSLPDIALESQLQVTGVYDDYLPTILSNGRIPPGDQALVSLNILMRNLSDVTVSSGPPWWTWRKAVTLVITLLTTLAVALLWIYLLRSRLERQQAAQLAFSRQVLERLEDERRRIAVNLHDGLGQILLAIKNQALLVIQRPPDEQGWRQRLDEISGATSQAIEEVRQITHGLRPYQLDRLGLTQAIRASINRASTNSSISFAVRVEDIGGIFDKDAEIHIYRIVQEAVTNVVKHSSATEAAVVIKKRVIAVFISIRDNGRGFDSGKQSSNSHGLGYGLSGIAERVRILGGTLSIDSKPGEGVSLTVEIPMPDCKHETRNVNTHRG